jgi:hypothetical protein
VRPTVTPPRRWPIIRTTVSVCAIQGNFHNLQRYTPLLHTQERSHRRRIVCMFGNTFANLHNEILFVRNSLLGFAPGDFLLLNVPSSDGFGERRAAIMKKDRRFAGAAPLADMSARRTACAAICCGDTLPASASTEIKWVLDFAACPVPGSYAANQRGVVRMQTGELKQFSVHNIKRYDQALLDATMNEEGWRPVAHWRYAEEYHPGCCCFTSACAQRPTRTDLRCPLWYHGCRLYHLRWW